MSLLKRRPLLGTPTGWSPDTPEVMQRIYAARGVLHPEGTNQKLSKLLSPDRLGGMDRVVELLADAILTEKRIVVAGDYDCDGATGTAVAVRGLRMLGAKHVDFIVPNRFHHGYGLSPGLVDAMVDMQPEVIVTVDSGVASVEGVAYAKAKGITVVITDHHLPPEGDLPAADAIVNPNLKGDPFPSKALAGVGVMFYVLMSLRQKLRLTGYFKNHPEPSGRPEPQIVELLDIVALGTVADLVPLDENNRILVDVGLRRIRAGLAHAGINALIEIAKRNQKRFAASDVAFHLAPRLNAAGRMEDMRIGVMTLLEDDPVQAKQYAQQLDEINKDRRERQAEMIEQAEKLVLSALNGGGTKRVGIVVYEKGWHHGIVGLVASRLKEDLYRPVIALAPTEDDSGEVRGSARSIPGFHLRDALAVVAARNPGLIPKFGGHAMAAGLSLHESNVEKFREEFDKVAREALSDDLLNAVIYHDGDLPEGFFDLDFAHYLRACGPWGQAFPEPVFVNEFYVENYTVLGGKHLKMDLIDPRDGSPIEAIYFGGVGGPEPVGKVRIAFELNIQSWRDRESLQLMVRHLEKL